MAALEEIRRIAEQAARKLLQPTEVVEVLVQPEVSYDGESLVRIRIVIPDGQVDGLDFTQFFDATLQIKKEVQQAGDDRRALIGFVTPDEMKQIADPES